MTNTTTGRTEFRNDINGLRAWAVVAVILYHFRVPGFGGGFVGVDIFFVISGFLMTGIVVSGLERGELSLAMFYIARARRILPALIVVCAVLLAVGYWVLLPPDYKQLGTHTIFTLVFSSNIQFWREGGYFDTASHDKWLLHTWSLGLEWQFYMLLPVALYGLWKWRPGRRQVMAAMVVGLTGSLTLCILISLTRPSAAFYVLPTRVWEMLAGGVVFLIPNALVTTVRTRHVVELIGLALIVVAVAGFDASSPWPGWRVVIPVAGAVAVLAAAQGNSPWTSHGVVQWLGTRSYSLYLWHWPIVVALHYGEWQSVAMAPAAGLLLTATLGHLSYELVELRGRVHLAKWPWPWCASALVGAAAAGITVGYLIRSHDGIAGRFPDSIERVAKEAENKNPRAGACFSSTGTQSPSCIYGGNRLSAILLGDSHAAAVVTALAAAAPTGNDGIMDWTYSGCPTLFGVRSLSPRMGTEANCGGFLNWATEQLLSVPQDVPLVIVNRLTAYAVGHNEPWENDANIPMVYFSHPYKTASPEFLAEFARRVTDSACQLAKDRPVFLVRPFPEMGVDVPKSMARAKTIGLSKDIWISLEDYQQRHEFIWTAQDAARDRCGVKILDPLPFLCSDGRCNGAKDGRPLYFDDDHLSEYGNNLLIPMFSRVFE